MNVEHRQIIKDNRYHLQESICFNKLSQYLQDYKMFNKHMWRDIQSMSDLLDLLPTRGPKAFFNFIEILRKADYNKEADLLESPTLTMESNSKWFYKMSSTPLGYCLIINNVKFETPKHKGGQGDDLEYRYGSDVDAKSLCDFFEKADFQVAVKSNLDSKQMESCIQKFSEKDFSKVDSIILIIMSHGGVLENKELLYGTEGGFLYKKDIYDFFNNRNCKMQYKPKVFFFIACRGKGRDYGVPKNIPNESVDSVPILPSLSDILIINSSLPYHVSIRDHEKGSYFCQALVSVLNENYKIHDLETMIKLVNEKLEGKISEVYRIVQAAHTEQFSWKKKIMLYRNN